MIRQFLQWIFKILAQRLVARKKPIVIAITGTVGKTSAREAIAKVLSTTYTVRTAEKNFNNEWGVPFTILGVSAAGYNPAAWLTALYQGCKAAFFAAEYPDMLVLEYGIDKPGDMDYLVGIVPLDYAVITALGEMPVHVENFPSKEALWEEKLKITKGLKPDGVLLYNADDLELAKRASIAVPHAVSFGVVQETNVRAEAVKMLHDTNGLPVGVAVEMVAGSMVVSLRMHKLIGTHQLTSILAAAALGMALKISPERLQSILEEFEPPNGRLKLLKGIRDTFIFDDTYNAAPASAKSALDVLRECAPRRRIAVLGDMLELGEFTEEAHREIGRLVATTCDMLYTVGTRAKFIAHEAVKSGFLQYHVQSFAISDEVGKPLEQFLQPGDVVLVKGSQGMRMEKIVEEIMAEPQRKKELLVRQDARWLQK